MILTCIGIVGLFVKGQQVDWSIEAHPAKEQILGLAAQAGLRITVDDSIASRLVVLLRNGSSPLAAIEATCRAVGSSLVRDGDTWRVERTQDKLSEIRAYRNQQRIRWLKMAIQRAEERIATGRDSFFGFSKADRELIAARAALGVPGGKLSPSELAQQKLLIQIIRLVGIERIASLHSGEIVQYSDIPCSLTLPLPNAEGLVDQYESDSRNIGSTNEVPTQNKSLSKTFEGSTSVDGHLESGNAGGSVSPSGPLTHLSLRVQANENGVLISLKGYAANSEMSFITYLSARSDPVMPTPFEIMQMVSKLLDCNWIKVAPRALRAQQFASSLLGKTPFPEWFLNPGKEEPTNAFVAPSVAALAPPASKKCFVIAISDSLWPSVRRSIVGDRLCVTALAKMLSVWCPYLHEEGQDAVIWRPIDLEVDEASTVDRRALSRFMSLFVANHGESIRSLCQLYAEGLPKLSGACGEDSPLVSGWPVRACLASGVQPVSRSGPESWFHLLGAMTDDSWSELLAGKIFTVGELGLEKEVTSVLKETSTVGGSAHISALLSDPLTNLGQQSATSIRVAMRTSPAVVFQCWIPAKLDARLLDGWSPLASVVGFFGIPTKFVTLEGDQAQVTIGRDIFEQSLQKFRFRLGKQDGLEAMLILPSGARIRNAWHGRVDSDLQTLTYSELPQAVRDRIWQLCQERAIHLARSFQNARENRGQPFSVVGTPDAQKP